MPRLCPETMTARRDHLMAAALRCFERRGLFEATVDDICAEAQASKGGFYVHFESKAALVHALLARRHAELGALEGETAAGLEAALFDALFAPELSPSGARVELEAIAASTSDPALHALMAANLDRIEAQLRAGLIGLVEQGRATLRGEPAQIAAILHAYALGTLAIDVVRPSVEAGRRAELHALFSALVVAPE